MEKIIKNDKFKGGIIFAGILAVIALLSGCQHTHEYANWNTTKEVTCVEDGIQERICQCGEKETEAILAKGHVFVAATCTQPKTCSVCEETEGEALGHIWAEATCTQPKTCSVCEETEGEALGHTWAEVTCIQPKTCSVCEETEGEALGHTWVEATCIQPKTCSICEEIEGEALGHVWVEATCTQPKTCNVCQETEGDVLHTWVEATCIDIVCTKCGEIVKKQSHNYVTESEVPATLLSTGTLVQICTVCNESNTTVLDIVDPTTLDMPVIYISDYVEGAIPLTELKKSNGEIIVKYQYISNDENIESFECFSSIKIQGATSSGFPKKNFTVKFYEDEQLESKFKVDFGWGKEYKYCMKANWIDSSQARNIIGAKMFAQVIQTRETINPGLAQAPNYGVIDGYPVVVYVNDVFHGIYTMNIPKDSWMFGMEGKEDTKEALLMSDGWSDANRLYTTEGGIWEIEHCSTKDETWVLESFNKMVALLNCGDSERIKKEFENYLDMEAAIDNMLYTYFIGGADNVGKNILWVTYDGKVWIPSMYDMDGTFGIAWDGQPINITKTISSVPNALYQVLLKEFAEEVETRWQKLRQDVLTVENTKETFEEFFAKIPEIVYTSEAEKWTEIPYQDLNRTNMYTMTAEQLARLDAFFIQY